jgi:hypothetical protein
MLFSIRSASIVLIAVSVTGLRAADGDRDFSGAWTLDQRQSDLRTLPAPPGLLLRIAQEGSVIRCVESDGSRKSGAAWTYRTDNTATKYQLGAERMSSLTKWEGSALLMEAFTRSQYIDNPAADPAGSGGIGSGSGLSQSASK